MKANLCPKCGHDLAEDEILQLGQWSLTPREISFRGQVMTLTQQEVTFIYSIAKAYPQPISNEALRNRLGGITHGHLRVLRSSTKKAFGGRLPISNVRYYGYRWGKRLAV